MRVAILGCGPAGMMAAWAAKRNDADVVVFAPGKPSVISGAQYLHDEIPGLDIIPMQLHYKKFGYVRGYAQKVYGSPNAVCSWREFEPGAHNAYPLGAAYDAIWRELQTCIVTATVGRHQLAGLRLNFDLVISSIPRPSLCMKPEEHEFTQKYVWITDKEPPDLEGRIPKNTIIYNGLPEDDWYRASNIQGVVSTEFAQTRAGARKLPKPLVTTCDCHDGVMFVGRYGKWKKGVLVHNAYWEVEYALQSMQ